MSGKQIMSIECDGCGYVYERGDIAVSIVRARARAEGWKLIELPSVNRNGCARPRDLCQMCDEIKPVDRVPRETSISRATKEQP